MKKTLLFAAAALLFAAQAATAQTAVPMPAEQAPTTAAPAPGTPMPRVRASQANQHARIKQGVQSGQLTPAEADRMRARQAGIRQEKQAAKADGVVTKDERQAVRSDQRKASRAIYRQKHDVQTR